MKRESLMGLVKERCQPGAHLSAGLGRQIPGTA